MHLSSPSCSLSHSLDKCSCAYSARIEKPVRAAAISYGMTLLED